jgi:glycerophosphoryl diester phosphodiesterase
VSELSETSNTIILNAHRGYQPVAPENSIPSFEAAGKLGFTYIETDAHLTRDGYLVCIHDSTIDRTYDGSGTVEEMTLAELKGYHMDMFAAYCTASLSDFSERELQIPLFSEYLEICRRYGSIPFIETKTTLEGEALDAYLKRVVGEALAAGFQEKDLVLSSLRPADLIAARRLYPEIFLHDIWKAGIETMASLNTGNNCGIAFNVKGLDEAENYAKAKELIDQAHAKGLKACLRAVDDRATVEKMLELGVDYIPTNKVTPAMVADLRAGRSC